MPLEWVELFVAVGRDPKTKQDWHYKLYIDGEWVYW